MDKFFNFAYMEPQEVEHIDKSLNSKGAAIFKKMLEDKREISRHLRNGGELTDLKDKFTFLDPLSFYKAE